MGSKKYKISEEEAKEIIKECYSIADFCRKIGCKPTGSNYKTFYKYKKEYNLDTSHFNSEKRNLLNGGVQIRKNAEEYAKGDSIKSCVLLRKLIEDGIKEHKCECCKNTEWLGDKIPLELHHIDGNHFNNSFDNLMVLCPNCHAKTDTYKGKKTKKEKEYKCEICGEKISRWSKSKICIHCSHKKQRITEWPQKEKLEELLKKYNFTKVAKIYNVSDNTIRNWCEYYGMSTHSKDYI